MQKRQIFVNAIMSVVQIIVIGVTLFILYRFLLNTIGIEQLGIWSLVLAAASVTSIAQFGLSGSVVKFVAKYIARREEENVSKVIQTAAVSVTIFIGLILLIGYPVIKWILGLVVATESLHLAISILPHALIALWIMVIASVFHSGLDGCQRIDIRSSLLMVGSIIHLFLCFLLAPRYGLIGVAYARVIQNSIILICSWFFLKRYLPILPFFPRKWDKKLFKEIIGYGINFQIISITQMMYDPITKALLSKFGGLSMVGYYEMVSRMVLQVRSLIVAGNQVLVPTIAELKEKIEEKIKEIYLTSYRLLFYLSLPLFSLMIVSLPLISQLWIGHYEETFVIFGIILAVGWFLNMLNAPSYFAYLGIGELRWNVIGHISIGILNLCLAGILGFYFDGIGVVIGWVVSLAIGSSLIYISYHLNKKISLTELIPKSSRLITVVCITAIGIAFFMQNKFNYIYNMFVLNSLIIFFFLMGIIVPFWYHPMRKRLVGWISSDLLDREI